MSGRGKTGPAILGILVVLCAARLWFGFRSPPQLPPSAEVFKTVDALFTAVTARDPNRLDACQQRLENYHHSAQLSDAAWKRLNNVIATAKSGNWDSAAHRLYDFMQAQRREPAAVL